MRRQSNACATGRMKVARPGGALAVLCCAIAAWGSWVQSAEARQEAPAAGESRPASIGRFLAGAATGLVAHEAGHLLFDVVFGADPHLDKVDFHGIPFFAIGHRADISSRQELVISSAGFWVQHAGSEWILTRHPRLRRAHAPFKKGMLAFNVFASVAYAGAAFATTGPPQRDTYGMARSARIDEPWIGGMILAPAVLDALRYFDPDARWAAWLSRAFKAGLLVLVFR